MPKKHDKKQLLPFERAIENATRFKENVNLYESVLLLAEAVVQLDITHADDDETTSLDEMLKSTIIQFSEFLEDRGDLWN